MTGTVRARYAAILQADAFEGYKSPLSARIANSVRERLQSIEEKRDRIAERLQRQHRRAGWTFRYVTELKAGKALDAHH